MEGSPPVASEVWNRTPPEVQALVEALLAEVAQLRASVAALREQLGQNSTNSSKPPSTDPPNRKRPPPAPPSGKARGGQPGHPRHQRPLVPPDQVDEATDVKPLACRGCQAPLSGDDPAPRRHQVAELPPVTPHVTEYRLHRLVCPQCGTATAAALPPGVPHGAFGPRLQATLALLAGGYRIGKDGLQALAHDLWGLTISQGMIAKLEQRTAAAVAEPVAQLHRHLQSEHVHVDETGWREGRRRAWLWTAVTATAAVFLVAGRRSAAAAQRLLGPGYRQVATTDRWKAYDWLPRRQLCWAHLRRDFQAMIDRDGPGRRVGQRLLDHSDVLFGWWHRVRDGTWRRATLVKSVGLLRADFRADLEAGVACGCAKTAATCQDLLAKERFLWTFVRTPGVEPTNNAAERAVRHAVLYRKVSGGTDSAAGSRFVERLLSVVATCRLQQRTTLAYLTACCQAHMHGTAAPSLLPQAAVGAA